ncbi:MAG: hypothetical protein ACRD1R_20970 [Acidobacteriota bacterium]
MPTLEVVTKFNDLGQAEQRLALLERKLDEMGDTAQKSGKKIESSFQAAAQHLQSVGQRMTLFVTAPLLAAGAGAIKAASDAEEMRSKFDAVFKGLSTDVRQWAATQAVAWNRSSLDLQEYLARLQDTFVPLGFAREESAKLSKTLTQLGVDLASFNNEAEPEVINALTSAIVGNHEAVRRFGIVITEGTLKQELFNMGIAGGIKEATEQEKVLARMNIIMRSTTDAQGDAARTAGSFANEMKGLWAATKDVAVAFGDRLIPQAKEWVRTARETLRQIEDLNDGTKDLAILAGGVTAALGPGAVALGTFGLWMDKLLKSTNPVIRALGRTGLIGTIAALSGAAIGFSLNRLINDLGHTSLQANGLSAAFHRTESVSGNLATALLGPVGALIRLSEQFVLAARLSHAWATGGLDAVLERLEPMPSDLEAVNRDMEKFADISSALSPIHQRAQQELARLAEERQKDADATNRQSEEQQGLIEKFRSSINPSRELADNVRTLMTEFDKDTVVKAMADEIRDAAQRHRELGTAIDPVIEQLHAEMLAMELAGIAASDLNRSTNDLLITRRVQIDNLPDLKKVEEEFLATVRDNNDAIRKNVDITNNEWLPAWAKIPSGGQLAREEFERFREAVERNAEAGKDWGAVWRNQVSTVVTDLSRGIADAIVAWKGFGSALIETAKQFLSAILRLFMEQLFAPVLSGIMGLFSGKGFGAGFSGAGGFGNLAGMFGGAKNLFAGGAGIAGALGLGGVAMGAPLAGTGAAGTLAAMGSPALPLIPGTGGAGLLGSLGGLFTNPWTMGIGAALAGGFALSKLLTTNPFQEGSGEISRDFGGIQIGTNSVEQFIKGLGVDEDVFEGSRKLFLGSPKAFQDILLPAAMRQGKGEELLASFAQFESGFAPAVDFTEAIREAIETGNFEQFNQQFLELAAQSDRIGRMLPGLSDKFTAVSTSVADTAGNTEDLNAAAGPLRQEIESIAPPMGRLALATDALARSLGFAGDAAMDAFNQGFTSLAASLGNLQTDTATLSGTLMGFWEIMQERGIPAAQAQQRAWQMWGNEILANFNELQMFGAEIPPFLQFIVDWAQAQGLLTLSIDSTTGAVVAQTGAVKQARDAVAELAGAERALAAGNQAAKQAKTIQGALAGVDRGFNFEGFGSNPRGLSSTAERLGITRIQFHDLLRQSVADFGAKQTALANFILSQGFGSSLSDALNLVQPFVGSFERGTDSVPRTGMALVHRGERIVPAEKNRAGDRPIQVTVESGAISFTVSGSGGREEIARQVLDAMEVNVAGLGEKIAEQINRRIRLVS